MPANIKTLLDNDGNQVLPRTRSTAITMADGSTTLDDAIESIVTPDASSIVFTPVNNIASTTVQSAIQELDNEKAPKASPTFTGALTAPIVNATSELQMNGGRVQDIVNTKQLKNWIINGGFDVWQRGTSRTGAGNEFFLADRWKSGSIFYTTQWDVSRQSFDIGQTTVPNNPSYFLRTVVVSDYGYSYGFQSQRIEDVKKLAGKVISISFWAKADSTKYITTEFIQNFGSGGSSEVNTIEPTKFTLSNYWQRYTTTLILPSVVGKTIGANNYTELRFWITQGAYYDTLRSGQLGEQSGTFDIANVTLVEGTVPMEWQTEAYADVLRQCQRYYQRWGDISGNPRFSIALTMTSTTAVMYIQPNVPFRITPTSVEYNSIYLWDGANVYACSSLGIGVSNYNGLIGVDATSSGLTFGRTITGLTYGGSYAYFALNAEL